jgi:hypothetical protein
MRSISCVVFAALATLVVVCQKLSYELDESSRRVLTATTTLDARASAIEIVLAGDSLIQIPSKMFKITTLLENELTESLKRKKGVSYDIQVQRLCGPSLSIVDLYDILDKALTSREQKKGSIPPDAIVIYGDSDM